VQAYATAERTSPSAQLRLVHQPSDLTAQIGTRLVEQSGLVFDELLGRLADLIVDRMAARLGTTSQQDPDEWLDTRRRPTISASTEIRCAGSQPPESFRASRPAQVASCTSAVPISIAGVSALAAAAALPPQFGGPRGERVSAAGSA
jgi:hypothetical protein